MLPAVLLLAVLLPGLAAAQPRPFTCIGAEQLEDDVFAIPFARSAGTPGDAARTNLAAAAERAKREPERMLCVLGHAGPQEGGAQTGLQLAAKRAGEVAAALARLGVERDRVRAEARRAAFAKGAVPEERSVTVVLLPAAAARPQAERRPEAPARAPDQPARPEPAARLPEATAPERPIPERPIPERPMPEAPAEGAPGSGTAPQKP